MSRYPAKSSGPSQAERFVHLTAAARFVVLHGNDRFMQSECLRTLREALEKVHGASGIDTVRFDGQQGGRIVAEVMDECRSFGLMLQHKIVLVDNAEMLVKSEEEDGAPAPPKAVGKKSGHRMPAPLSPREVLEGYAANPSSSATLVLRAGTWRGGNLDKRIAALGVGVGVVQKCELPSFEDAVAWTMTRCSRRHNSTIAQGVARGLVELTGVELGRIDTELEKLAIAAGGDGSPITHDLVGMMVGKARQEAFFAIQSSLLTSDAARVLNHLRDLVEVSRQDPVPLAWSCIEVVRKLHGASRARAAGNDVSRMQYQLKVFGDGVAEMMANLTRLSGRVSPAEAAELMQAAVEMDSGNKSGFGDPLRNLEVMAVRLAAL